MIRTLCQSFPVCTEYTSAGSHLQPCAAAPQVNVNKVWLTVSSVLLGFSFVFGTSIRTTFESVVFLFVVHPYDVGDMLLLTDPNDLPSGQQYCQVRNLLHDVDIVWRPLRLKSQPSMATLDWHALQVAR